MDKAESLEYMANIVSELKRDLDLSTVASVQEWSFATKPYRVIQ
jgi:hypothetical protein